MNANELVASRPHRRAGIRAAVNPNRQHRLRFWAAGDQLTVEFFDRDNLDTPIPTCTVTDGRIPAGIGGLYGTKSAGTAYDATIDQFMLTGEPVH